MSFYKQLIEKVSLLEKQVADKKAQDANYPWYLTSAKKEGKVSAPWFVVAGEMPDKLKLRFWKTLLYFVRIWMIISGAPSSNFNVFTQAGKEGVYICNYNYCYYKGFHKNTKWKFITAVTASTIILSLIVALIFPGKPITKAATYNWTQSSWSGGPDSGAYPNHNSDQTDWAKYSDKETIDLSTTGEVTLATTPGSWTQTNDGTTDAGFNATGGGGTTKSQVTVSGNGDSANVILDNAPWYNTSWGYRKSIAITGSAGANTDYLVKVLVGESSGTVGTDVNVDGHSTATSAKFDDVSFTDNTKISSGELSYWRESVTGSGTDHVATFWVKVTADLGSNQTIYIYYGNTAATNASDITILGTWQDGNPTYDNSGAGYATSSTVVSGGTDVALGSDTWYNSSWTKRRTITLNTPTTVANYPVKVTLSSATLTGAELTGGNANGNDIRFTGSDKTTLQNYWIESWSATGTSVTATIWVNVISATSTLYMYYGNTSATAASDGANTFAFYDDFSGSSKWTASGTGTSGTSGEGYVTASQTGAGTKTETLTTTNPIGTGTFSATVKIKDSYNDPWPGNTGYSYALKETTTGTNLYVSPTDNNASYVSKTYILTSVTNAKLQLYATGTGYSSDPICQGDTWCYQYSDIDSCNSDSDYCSWNDGLSNGTGTIYIDDVYVRNYVSGDITASGVGIDSETGNPYAASGTFTSVSHTTPTNSSALVWADWTRDGGSQIIIMDVRAGAANPPTTSWTTSITKGGSLTSSNITGKYIQYLAHLSTGDTSQTPTLNDVTLYYRPYVSSEPSISATGSEEGYAQYYSTGTFTSQIKDIGFSVPSWANLVFTQDSSLPAGTSVKIKVQTAPNNSGVPGIWTSYGADFYYTSSGDKYSTCGVASGVVTCPLVLTNGNRFVRYQVTLAGGTNTPTLSDVKIEYNYYPTSYQSLTSSAYNTLDASSVISAIAWSESGATGGNNIRFQVRTAPNNNNGTLSDTSDDTPNWAGGSGWCGPTNCAATTSDTDYASDADTTKAFYETTPAGEALNSKQGAANSDSISDQWIQYKVWLVSGDGSSAPKISGVSPDIGVQIQYVVNSSPCIGTNPDNCATTKSTLTASNSNNTITVNGFKITDHDEKGNTGAETTDKDWGTVDARYFYDIGLTVGGAGTGTGNFNLAVNANNDLLPETNGYLLIDDGLNSEVVKYAARTGVALAGVTRGTWPPDSSIYTSKVSAHSSGKKVYFYSASAADSENASANSVGTVTGISSSDSATRSVELNTATDFSHVTGGVFVSGAKAVVTVNDGNGANQVASPNESTDTFDIDTKVPVGNLTGDIPVQLDMANSQLNIGISDIAGETATKMRFSASDLSGTSCASGTWTENYATSRDISDLNLSPVSGVYMVYWQFKDDNCNMISGSASTPATPTPVTAADVSYGGLYTYRNLVWWTLSDGATSYKIKRCVLGSSDALDKCDSAPTNYNDFYTINSGSQNYCFDKYTATTAAACDDQTVVTGTASDHKGLVDTSRYYYIVNAEKADGISSFASSVDSMPTGDITGKIDTTAPSITFDPANNLAANPEPATGIGKTPSTLRFKWATTPTDSGNTAYSLVKYKKSADSSWSFAGDARTFSAAHDVTISGLAANTAYDYQLLSADLHGNLAAPSESTVTTAEATISLDGTPGSVASRDTAIITWKTNIPSTSRVKYIDASSDSNADPVAGTFAPLSAPMLETKEHYVMITGLDLNKRYNYEVISTAAGAPDFTYYDNSVTYFTTLDDKTDNEAPQLVASTTPAPSPSPEPTIATIIWHTNENSYSLVRYGESSTVSNLNSFAGFVDLNNSGEVAQYVNEVSSSDYQHTVSLANLIPGKTYHYQVLSADSSGNLAIFPSSSTTYSFDTADLSIVGSPTSFSSRSSAIISWTTNGPSDSQVRYKIKADTDTCNLAFVSGIDPTRYHSEGVVDHIVAIPASGALTPDKTYCYEMSSHQGNNTANAEVSSTGTFSTGLTGAALGIIYGSNDPHPTSADITFSATSDNGVPEFVSVEYEQSDTVPETYSKESAQPVAVASGVNTTITLDGLTSGKIYYFKLKARDAFGNKLEDANSSYHFETTVDTSTPDITFDPATDVTAIYNSATIRWTTGKLANARIDWVEDTDNAGCGNLTYTTGTVLAGTANDNLNINHSITLSSLNPEKVYCYKLISTDNVAAPNTHTVTRTYVTDGDTASGYLSFTTPVQVDTTIPTITEIKCDNIAVPGICTSSTTSATITWKTTGRKSSSLVDFALATDYSNSVFTQGNYNDDIETHSVTLVGLAPGTDYRFRVKSMDSSSKIIATDDNDTVGYLFTTQTAEQAGTLPVITSVQISDHSSSSATIAWTTSIAADSTVGYSAEDKTYVYEKGVASTSTSHSVTLDNLNPATVYFFQVKSRNGNELGALSSDSTYPNGFTFTTDPGADITPPNISDIQVASVTANKATISWKTNEKADSFVEFGTTQGAYTSIQGNPSDSALIHSVILTSLTPDTQYYFQVRSTDGGGNKAVMVYSSGFKTTTGDAVDCPAVRSCPAQAAPEACPIVDVTAPKITGIKISDITFNAATITWTTDEDSNSMVGYDINSYDVKGKFTYSSGASKDSTKSHSVTLNNLDSANTYYFRVLSTDASGNTAESTDQFFKTPAISESSDKGAATADNLKKQFESIAKTLVKDNLATEQNIKDILSRIINPPVIGSEGPIVKDIQSYGATISWQTDRNANSIVKFTIEQKTGSLAKEINWKEIGMTNIFDTKHEVTLLGLTPSTAYSYQAQSQDMLGNTSSSDIKIFTTASASSIFNVLVTDLNLTSAKITWSTANISSSSLEYGPTSDYGNYQENKDEKVKEHSISLANLAPNSVFHFRVRSTEELGTILVSDDYSFTTPALPVITKYELGEVKDNSIALTWTSNIPINTSVRYTNSENNEVKNITKEEKTIDHALTIDGLEAGKTYKIEIQGRDDANNLATIPSFDVQTGMDTVAPEISQVRSQSAVLSTADDKVQSIISWKTNELASTKVLWDIGGTKGDTLANETVLDANLTTNHIVVLTQFKPGTVYRFRVVSADKFGNTSTSADYTVLAPVKRQSIIQMIITQFENIFGWTKGLGL